MGYITCLILRHLSRRYRKSGLSCMLRRVAAYTNSIIIYLTYPELTIYYNQEDDANYYTPVDEISILQTLF